MDPLSVSASVIGILGAAAKVSSVLAVFVKNTRAAPKLAQKVLNEVNGLSAIVGHLQNYLLGFASPSKSCGSLILVEQVIVTLAECVKTFSELEDILGSSTHDGDMALLDRMKWALKESKIADVQAKLQGNKASLTLMLTILQCNSMEEAETATNRLCTLVERVLAENREMSMRLRDMDDKSTRQARDPRPRENEVASETSSEDGAPKEEATVGAQRNMYGFAFEEDLLASRVYRRPLFSESGESLVTSAARTTASSILSALSLTDVSNISILAVPIYAHEISNSRRYTFGDFSPDSVASEQLPASKSLKETLKANKWDGFASAVWRRRQVKKLNASPKRALIMGVPLLESIKYANVAISLTDQQGKSFIYGYIPIIVAKAAIFLKEQGTDAENIFAISGSALRLKELETAFDSPPRYGKGFDWSGYTVHDAAALLFRYLFRLPEPVIPLEHYEAFQKPLRSTPEGSFLALNCESFDPDAAITTYQRLITELPPLSRQLLLYLLDLLAVFASKSDRNRMTSPSLAHVFQPVILSPVILSRFIEEEAHRRLSQDVLIFLIENQDHFLIGYQGTATGEPDEHAVDEYEANPRADGSSEIGEDNVRRVQLSDP